MNLFDGSCGRFWVVCWFWVGLYSPTCRGPFSRETPTSLWTFTFCFHLPSHYRFLSVLSPSSSLICSSSSGSLSSSLLFLQLSNFLEPLLSVLIILPGGASPPCSGLTGCSCCCGAVCTDVVQPVITVLVLLFACVVSFTAKPGDVIIHF